MTSTIPSSTDKDLLILTCVHGNEDFANAPVRALQEQYGDRFDWVIGNPNALEQRVRYTDIDINRIAPGSPDDPLYEARRAAELLRIASGYPYVIDIHGTTADCGVFSLIPGAPLTMQRLALATALPIENVVIWADEAERQSGNGPLSPLMPCGIAVECGPKNVPEIAEQLLEALRSVVRDGIGGCLRRQSPKKLFRVYGSLKKTDLPDGTPPLRDFEQARVGDEKFFPLLSGQYENTACYKMEEVDLWRLFSYEQARELRQSS